MELTLQKALEQGIAAHRAGKLREAEKLYKSILGAQPKHPDANHNLGILAVGVGKIEEALPFFKTALESNVKVEQFWLSYINALIKLDRLHDARKVLQQGRGLGLKGDKVDQLATQLTDEVPGPVRATHPNKEQMDGVIALYTQGKFEEALVQGNILAGQFPNSHMVPNILGAIYSRLEKHEEAVAHYSLSLIHI